MAEYDSPWKEALDEYFEPFLQFCFPDVCREIDWTRGYVPLDKELQKISPKGELGQRAVEKLTHVRRTSGDEGGDSGRRQGPESTGIRSSRADVCLPLPAAKSL